MTLILYAGAKPVSYEELRAVELPEATDTHVPVAPSHNWGDKTAWRLFNAATFALAGRVAEKPDLTKRLHEVIDGTLN